MHIARQGISRVQSVSSACDFSNRCRASSRARLTSSVRMHSMHSALNKACPPRELPNPRAEPLRDADLGSQSCVKPCRIAVVQRDDWRSIKFKRAAPRLISGDSRSPAACEQDLKHERRPWAKQSFGSVQPTLQCFLRLPRTPPQLCSSPNTVNNNQNLPLPLPVGG
jgi:hypothetical protein